MEEDIHAPTTGWRPTPEQYAAYKAREIVLCKHACEQHAKMNRYRTPLKHNQTLFSEQTWMAVTGSRE